MAIQVPAGAKLTIEGRIFRAKKKKYRWMPNFLWKWGLKKGLPWTGRWEKKQTLV